MNTQNQGSAHRGLGEWLLQRLSALYLGGFVLWLLLRLIISPLPDFMAWKGWVAGGGVRLAFALFMLSLLIHAWLGMRTIFIDYLRPLWLRFTAQILLALGLLTLAFWSAQILLLQARA